MSRKPLIQARVEHHTSEGVEDYADDQDLSRSEALRRLLHIGLAAEGYSSDGTRSWLERIAAPRTVTLALLLMLAGLTGTALAAVATTGVLYALSLTISAVAMAAATLTATAAMLAQMALARPLRGLVGLARGETA